MSKNASKKDDLWDTEDFNKKCTSMYNNAWKTWSSMRHRGFEEKCTFMYNNLSKHDHLWDREKFEKKLMSMYNNT